MEQFEKVEKLRERANVTYEEAREALEQSNWDILDAMIYLEKQGRTKSTEQSRYSTRHERVVGEIVEAQEPENNFKDSMKRFGKWLAGLLEKGNTNSFCVERDEKEIFKVPVTVLVVFLIFAFWVVLPLLVIGLFLNMRYHFQGPDVQVVDIDMNKAMDSAAQTAETIKSEFCKAASKNDNVDANQEQNE